jgi:hypothetical protein
MITISYTELEYYGEYGSTRLVTAEKRYNGYIA